MKGYCVVRMIAHTSMETFKELTFTFSILSTVPAMKHMHTMV